MCGVLALLSPQKSSEDTKSLVDQLLVPLQESRGPDAKGVQIVSGDEYPGHLVFGHARLSIIDLSHRSNQPLIDSETGLALTYNGEIYNYRDLRRQLEAHYTFRTESDSEVLLAGLRHWGLQSTLQRLRGMFAFVAYDPKRSQLMAARDRAGEKPLSFGQVDGDWLFASDLRVLSRHPRWDREVSLEWLQTYFTYRFVPHPYSIFSGFQKLGPGQMLTLNLATGHDPIIENYWDIASLWSQESLDHSVDDREVIQKVVKRTIDASDVPVGTFLSGGIDSSLVTALAAQHSDHPVKAYTIKFLEEGYDESPQAVAVAKQLSLDHTILPFGFNDFKEAFQELNSFLDEPCAVHSFFPLGKLAKRAREDVKVCLSGDGGDELFAGYNRYIFWHKYMSRLLSLPSPARKLASGLFESGWAAPLLDEAFAVMGLKQASDKRKKISLGLKAKDMEAYYQTLLQQEFNPMGDHKPIFLNMEDLDGLHRVERMMAMDFSFYLPCDVLTKVDRATMAVGLEARAPLLDLDVIEMAGHMPISQKIKGGQGKANLRAWLNDLIPGVDWNEQKSGFTTPITLWRDRLFDSEFFSSLESSDLYHHLDPKYVERLRNHNYGGEEGFTLYCVLHWLNKHDLKLV